jgi:hypothetical protein
MGPHSTSGWVGAFRLSDDGMLVATGDVPPVGAPCTALAPRAAHARALAVAPRRVRFQRRAGLMEASGIGCAVRGFGYEGRSE